MSQRERKNEGADRVPAHPSVGEPGGGLDAVRQAGERFLAAADEAIARALSGDSEAFLRASRQQGGQ